METEVQAEVETELETEVQAELKTVEAVEKALVLAQAIVWILVR